MGGEGRGGCGSGSRGLIGLGLLGWECRVSLEYRVCCLEMGRLSRRRWFWAAVRVELVGSSYETYIVAVSRTVEVISGRRRIVVVKVLVLDGRLG